MDGAGSLTVAGQSQVHREAISLLRDWQFDLYQHAILWQFRIKSLGTAVQRKSGVHHRDISTSHSSESIGCAPFAVSRFRRLDLACWHGDEQAGPSLMVRPTASLVRSRCSAELACEAKQEYRRG